VERAEQDADASRRELRQPVGLEEALSVAAQRERRGAWLVAQHDGLVQQVVEAVDDQRGRSLPRP